MALVEVEDLTFSYTAQSGPPALRGLSCAVERGTFIGVTGASEAGKTSFCRLISGYIPNFFEGELSGSVRVAGESTAESSIGELAQKVGFVFENPFDQLTGASMSVLEEAAFALENMGLPRQEILRRARAGLEQVGLWELAERHPRQLSGGQSQRLALASVLAAEPEIFILDEPTSQLDPLGVREVLGVVAGMHDRGYTIIMVSQDLDHLATFADRLLVLEEGRIKWDGEPREVLLAAAEARHPIRIPDTLELCRRLRSAGRLPADKPPPLTVEEAAGELAPALEECGEPPARSSATPSPQQSRQRKPDEAALIFDEVRYKYPSGVSALDGISLSLEQECVCIIGQNGAGKTTLVRHLNGLLRPTGGRVLVRGKDTRGHRVAALSREVGLAFQNPDDQLFRGTVEQEVSFGPENVGAAPEEARKLTERALDLMQLQDLRGRKPHDLGLAERKRVATASVVAMDTPVVVLDEPTGGQDAAGSALLGRLIEHLIGDGKLVIVVTHDVRFAAHHADRVIALHQGRVLLDGSPEEVFGQEDTLARTHVEPPTITRLGKRLGLERVVLTTEEFLRLWED